VSEIEEEARVYVDRFKILLHAIEATCHIVENFDFMARNSGFLMLYMAVSLHFAGYTQFLSDQR
jgi:hypothetical protein